MIQSLQHIIAALSALVATLSVQVAALPKTVSPDTQTAAVAAALAAVSQSGLVGHWRFDELTGTTASDSSGNKHVGTLKNSPAWVVGKMGGALSFDGSDDYVSIDYSIDSYPASICAWIYFAEDTDALSSIAGNDALSLILMNNPANQDYVQIFNNQNAIDSRPDSILPKTWNHICAVVDNRNNASIYINGALKSGPKNISAPIIRGKVAIGAASLGGAQRFKGFIDDVRIYNRALNAQEISGIYKVAGF